MNVEDLKCFENVAKVIGKEAAKEELQKVLDVAEHCVFEDYRCIAEAFLWSDTPQGSEFWKEINDGVNPYA